MGPPLLIAVFILLMVVILIPIHALSLLIFLFALIVPSARGWNVDERVSTFPHLGRNPRYDGWRQRAHGAF